MIRGQNVFLIGVRNVFHKYEDGSSETSSLVMKWVRNVFPNYDYAYRLQIKNYQPGSHDFRRFSRQFLTDSLEILQRPFLKYGFGAKRLSGIWLGGKSLSTLVPRATLRGVAELHVAFGMPQWECL